MRDDQTLVVKREKKYSCAELEQRCRCERASAVNMLGHDSTDATDGLAFVGAL